MSFIRFAIMALLLAVASGSRAGPLGEVLDGAKQRLDEAGRMLDWAEGWEIDWDWVVDGALDAAAGKLIDLTGDVSAVMPELERIGVQLSSLRLELVPPSAYLRLVAIDFGEAPSPSLPVDATVLQKLVLTAASTAKRIQETMKFEFVILDVNVARVPNVKVCFGRKLPEGMQSQTLLIESVDRPCYYRAPVQ